MARQAGWMGGAVLLGAIWAALGGATVMAATTVHVQQHGAIPDDGKDDTAAVAAAIKALPAESGHLILDKGRYDLKAQRYPNGQPFGLAFRDLANVTIDGRGATLMFADVMPALAFNKCRGVVVRNLTIDYARPPFSVGRVVARAPGSFDVQVEAQFPVAGGEPVGAFMEYDPKTRLPLRHGVDAYDWVDSTELAGPQRLRVKLKGDPNRSGQLTEGALVVLRHQVYGHSALSCVECSDVRIEDVTVRTAPGMGLIANHTTNMLIRRLAVCPPPGADRIMSTTADATHFNGCMGEIRIEDCTFEGMGDDAVNVHGMWHVVRQIVDDRTIVTACRNDWINPPQVGHVMEFASIETILPCGSAKVVAVDVDRQAKTHRLRFDAPLPAALKVGDVAGDVNWAPKLRITGCTTRGNRARGFLIQTRDALIENNTFDRCTGAGIHVTTDVHHWKESIGTRNVVIRNNTFTGCNYAAARAEAVINVFAHVDNWQLAPQPGVHRNVTIEGNTIRGTERAAIFVSATDGAVVRGNTIADCCRAPDRTSSQSAIYFYGVRNAQAIGNRFEGDRPPQMRDAIGIGPGCQADTITIRDNEGF